MHSFHRFSLLLFCCLLFPLLLSSQEQLSGISFNQKKEGIEHWDLNYYNNQLSEIQRFQEYPLGNMIFEYDEGKLQRVISTDIENDLNNFSLDISYDVDQFIERVTMNTSTTEFQYRMKYKGGMITTVDRFKFKNGNWQVHSQYLYEYNLSKLILRVFGEVENGMIYPSFYTSYDYSEKGALMTTTNEAYASHQYATKYMNYNSDNDFVGFVEHFYHPDEGILDYKPEENYAIEETVAISDVNYPSEVFELFEILPELPFNEIANELRLILSDRKVYEVTNEEGLRLYDFEYKQLTEQDNWQSRKINFQIYPNPSASIVHIPNQLQITSIQIINSLGQKMLNYKLDSNIVNIEQLPLGTYWLQVLEKNGKVHNLKFAKM